ncbi:unnamed protein product, partial [Cladocopium goreaui]
ENAAGKALQEPETTDAGVGWDSYGFLGNAPVPLFRLQGPCTMHLARKRQALLGPIMRETVWMPWDDGRRAIEEHR